MVKVAESGEDGTLLHLGLLVVLLERVLIKPPLGLVLAGGVLALAIAPTGVVLVLATLKLVLLLGAVGDEVVGVTAVVATLLASATPPVQAVVVKPHKPTGHKHQLLIPK